MLVQESKAPRAQQAWPWAPPSQGESDQKQLTVDPMHLILKLNAGTWF
jgi:hypothetical protein